VAVQAGDHASLADQIEQAASWRRKLHG
jgi:hypothetical protein